MIEIIFLVSGLGLALLIFEKLREERRRKSSFLLRLISLGDARMHALSERATRLYADTREDAQFFLKKQLPLRTRNFYNKSKTVVAAKLEILLDDLRDSKVLRKSGGISEFYESLSEKDNQSDDSQESPDKIE